MVGFLGCFFSFSLNFGINRELVKFRAVFQMTVESNYVIVIATHNDWLKRLEPVFQPMRSKPKTNCTTYA